MPRRSTSFWVFVALLVIAHFVLHVAVGLDATEAPDLLTVALLLAARSLSGGRAAVLGLVLGLLRDALSLIAFGADAIVLTVLGYLGSRTRDFFVGDSLLFTALYLFIGKWVHDALYFVFAGAALEGGSVDQLLIRAPLSALYAAAAGVVALLLYNAFTRER